MEKKTVCLTLATVVTIICFYFIDYSLWWTLSGVTAALIVCWLCVLSQEQALVASLFILVLDVFAYYNGASLWLVLGIPVGLLVLGSLYLGFCDLIQQDRDERHRRGSTQTYSVPNPPRRTADERTSLLPSHSRVPTETPSRSASQPSYLYRSSLHSTPKVLHTAPDTSFRVIVDPGLLRHSTPTVAVDPRLVRYTSPTTPPSVAFQTRRAPPSNGTSASLMAAAESRLVLIQPVRNNSQLARNILPPPPAPVARQEIDGALLHEALAAEVGGRYPYDQHIETERNQHRGLVKGYFRCYNCKPRKDKPRTWDSNAICVEIWMSSGHRYRTQLHSQMCLRCNSFVEPEVIKDDYVTMVVKVLDRWTGQTSVVKPRQKYFKTGPHLRDKCNACLRGICPLKPEE